MNVKHFARALALALGVVVAQSSPARAQDTLDAITMDVEVENGASIEADNLLVLWSRKLGVPIIRDQQMMGTRIKLASGPISWGAFKKVLDFHDIVIEQKNILSAQLLFAHLRRNLCCRAAPPFPLVTPDKLAAMGDQIVTLVMKVENGGANDIFATVRGLLVRDANRIGNILYVRGPETIIIVDYAYNVEYYAKVIRALDVPGAATRVFHLEHANAEDAALAVEPLADPGTKVVPAPRTNQLLVRGPAAELARMADLVSRIDVPAGAARPRFRAETPGVALWKLATVFAVVAFVGQTILMRRFQKRALLIKLPV